MGFPARFAGTCKNCGSPITVGQYITWSRRERGCAYHADCTNPNHRPESNPETEKNEEIESLKAQLKAEQESKPESKPDYTVNGIGRPSSTSSIEQAITDLVSKVSRPVDIDSIKSKLDSYISNATEAYTASLSATIEAQVAKIVVPRNITITVDNREIKLENVTPHKALTDLLYLVTMRENVYLYGDPGWGKSQAAHDVAKVMGLEFGFTALTLQTSDTRLTGFRDAHGNYHATPIRTLYANGGVFLVDEVDRANGNTLTALNSMLANGHGQFPDGLITRHADFICIATGNTVGTGANLNFPDCRPLDAAFRDRFFFLEWGEDNAFERTIALGINSNASNWIGWIQAVRSYVKDNNLRLIVSPRATYKGALHIGRSTMSIQTLAEGVLWRGAATDTVKRILSAYPYPKVAL